MAITINLNVSCNRCGKNWTAVKATDITEHVCQCTAYLTHRAIPGFSVRCELDVDHTDANHENVSLQQGVQEGVSDAIVMWSTA
jgi:hypothetical protein